MSMLEVRELSVAYGTHPVLEPLDLDVAPGEILAVIGPNGAGKTSLIRALSGVIPPAGGRIWIDGEELNQLSPQERARRIAVVPQARNLPPAFPVWQVVFLGRTPHLGWLGRSAPEDQDRVSHALARTHTMELADRRVGELSGGEQQRVLLARALAQDAPLLLLDEPTVHLDLHHQARLLTLVRALADEDGRSVLMALHDLNAVSRYADRVLLLSGGREIARGQPAEVLTPDHLLAAYQTPVQVLPHPETGLPLVIPDGDPSPRSRARSEG